MKKIGILTVFTAVVATPALAAQVQVPEPSMLGLSAAAMVGMVIAYRLRRRK